MKKGFTIAEILIFVVVFAVLIGFTVPKFMTLMHKAEEGSTKQKLVQIRAAIAAYYGDHKGVYPTDDLSCLVPNYIDAIPLASIPGHEPSAKVHTGTYEKAFNDEGGWSYVSDPNDPMYGEVFVNEDDPDSYGKAWNTH